MSDSVLVHILEGVVLNPGAAVSGAIRGALIATVLSFLLGIVSKVLLVGVFAFFMLGGALMKVFPHGVQVRPPS